MAALTFITCGSVDDGKSTLIGRLLVDSKAVLQDQLEAVSRSGAADLALLTDGLSAEREQGITIDVAYRYFSTTTRKFIIGDTPGHEQYTRNMVTAATVADAAILLVDATKLDWRNPQLQLLPQTRRHALLCQALRVPSLVFAINKLDAVDEPEVAFEHIAQALHIFAESASITPAATLPISALHGHNILHNNGDLSSYNGHSLLQILEQLPNRKPAPDLPLALCVQWIEKTGSAQASTHQGRRVFWGRLACGTVQLGDVLRLPSGQTATVTQLLSTVRQNVQFVRAGSSVGIALDRELDVSRGDWLFDAEAVQTGLLRSTSEVTATVAWLDHEPLTVGRTYWALHGHQWLKARVSRIDHRLNIGTLAQTPATRLEANDIGQVQLQVQGMVTTLPYAQSDTLGRWVLVDTSTHNTVAAALLL